MTGKNFSANNVSGKRREGDFYETPYSITQQLLDVEKFDDVVLEPACGKGALAEILWRNGYFVVERDISTGDDFIQSSDTFGSIVTNPPFSKALEFILKAKEVCRNKFAYLLPLSYLHGEERFRKIFQDTEFPLAKVHVFTRYPMLGDGLRLDGKYRTGMMVYAWFVWDRSHSGAPEIHWISNQNYILNKKNPLDESSA